MVNSILLKARMVEKGYTQDELAKKIGISPQSLNYKINNIREFKVSEIYRICKILGIKNKDSYFFVSDVAKMTTK